LKALVSSKVYRQIEFQALGAWWIYSDHKLIRVPTSREDVAFADSSIDLRSRRAVMKILRFIVSYEEQLETWQPFAKSSFKSFLMEHFKLKPEQTMIVDLFLGLTLSTQAPAETLTEDALSRVARHIKCIGQLGAGFNAVLPKWGGLAEITQVACRAQAVGGGVYVLGTGVSDVAESDDADYPLQVRLSNGDVVKAKHFVSSDQDVSTNRPDAATADEVVHKSVSVISNPLKSLLPPVNESVASAGTVIVFPEKSFSPDSRSAYLIIHGSTTGECPQDQSRLLSSLALLNDDPLLNTYLHCLTFLTRQLSLTT
jgi:RAB protein geranylgeranyltransferase component A